MRSVSFMFPQRPETAHKNDGYVYVIEFDNGTVKVGQTKHPDKRLSQHRTASSKFGIGIAKYFVSEIHRGHEDTERALIKHAQKLAGSESVPGEYFTGIHFSDCVDFIKSLPLKESTDEEREQDIAEEKESLARWQKFFTGNRENAQLFPIYTDSEALSIFASAGLDPRFSASDIGEGVSLTSESAIHAIEIIQDRCNLIYEEALEITFCEFLKVGVDLLAECMRQNIELAFLRAGEEVYNRKYFKEVA